MEPTTDREIMIQLDTNIKSLGGAIEKLAISLEKLEEGKIKTIEDRLDKVDKWINQWQGVHKFFLIISLLASIAAVIFSLRYHV